MIQCVCASVCVCVFTHVTDVHCRWQWVRSFSLIRPIQPIWPFFFAAWPDPTKFAHILSHQPQQCEWSKTGRTKKLNCSAMPISCALRFMYMVSEGTVQAAFIIFMYLLVCLNVKDVIYLILVIFVCFSRARDGVSCQYSVLCDLPFLWQCNTVVHSVDSTGNPMTACMSLGCMTGLAVTCKCSWDSVYILYWQIAKSRVVAI